MSKWHPQVLAPLLLAAACEPITSSVVELAEREASVESVVDAAREPAPEDGAYRDPEEDDPEGCLILRDQTFPELISAAAMEASRVVVSRNAGEQGCTEGDAGTPLGSSTVCSRSDGLPILERGVRYSFRWPQVWTAMARVNIVGGDQFCAARTAINVAHGYLLLAGTITPASCYEFTSPIEARYLRLDGRDYQTLQWINLGKPPLKLKLCPTPCPAGTAYDFGDAGVDASTP